MRRIIKERLYQNFHCFYKDSRKRRKRLDQLTHTNTMKSQPLFSNDVKPIFIIGAPRSGTSILTWVLGQHPNIQPMPETSWIASMAIAGALSFDLGSSRERFSHLSNVEYPLEPFMRRMGETIDTIVCDVFEERCLRFYGDYRQRGEIRINPNNPNKHMQIRRSVDDPKRRWVDGTPMNTQFIWPLQMMFPNAKFIHNLRRPEDVAASLENFDNVGAVPQELNQGLETWIQHTENAWLAEQAFGEEKVFRLDFTRIKNDQEKLVRDLLTFLDEDYCEDCLLPFGKRINSSDVDNKRDVVKNRISGMKLFQIAEALYNQATDFENNRAASEAAGIIKQRFLDHIVDKNVI